MIHLLKMLIRSVWNGVRVKAKRASSIEGVCSQCVRRTWRKCFLLMTVSLHLKHRLHIFGQSRRNFSIGPQTSIGLKIMKQAKTPCVPMTFSHALDQSLLWPFEVTEMGLSQNYVFTFGTIPIFQTWISAASNISTLWMVHTFIPYFEV